MAARRLAETGGHGRGRSGNNENVIRPGMRTAGVPTGTEKGVSVPEHWACALSVSPESRKMATNKRAGVLWFEWREG